jgi:predicted DNA-binding protein with PD1-like motif
MNINVMDAIQSLIPNARCIVTGTIDDFSIVWLDEENKQLTKTAIKAEYEKLTKE